MNQSNVFLQFSLYQLEEERQRLVRLQVRVDAKVMPEELVVNFLLLLVWKQFLQTFFIVVQLLA